jgi:Family of unknown function (DUF6504)
VSRLYGEPIDVWVQDGKPARFAWRGRLYTVFGVLDHWVASREWWKQQGRGEEAVEPSEHGFWRVEAAPGRNIAPATYELRQDTATGGWMLTRVWD